MVALCACNSKQIQVKASLATIKDCWKAIGSKYYPLIWFKVPLNLHIFLRVELMVCSSQRMES